MDKIYDWVIRFIREREGASGIEYAIVAAMVAVVLVLFMGPISGAIRSMFSGLCTALGGTGCPAATG